MRTEPKLPEPRLIPGKARTLHCPFCYQGVDEPGLFCARCRVQVHVRRFPALYAAASETPLDPEDESARCFFHDDQPAADLCSRCGRMVCSHCRVENAKQQILCPACGSDSTFKAYPAKFYSRIDDIVFMCAVLSFVAPLSLISIPTAVLVVIFGYPRWKMDPLRNKLNMWVCLHVGIIKGLLDLMNLL